MQTKSQKLLEMWNGQKIPQIGYGTYQLKGPDCINGVTYALECGYRYIDTASIYKNAPEIKEALMKSNIPREEIFITSKISPNEQGYENTLKACQTQLDLLGLKYLDLYLIHWPGVAGHQPEDKKNAEIRLETYRAMEKLLKEGLIKNIGVSNFLKRHLEHLLANVNVKPVVNQIEVHPLGWDVPTIEYCNQHKILIEAYSPLARSDPQLLKNHIILNLAEHYNKTAAQICLKWATQKGFIILPKSRRKECILENFQIFDFNLTENEIEQIDTENRGIHTCWDPEKVTY